MKIRGGAEELLEMEFTSNVAEMQPYVLYTWTAAWATFSSARLAVRHSGRDTFLGVSQRMGRPPA